MGVLGVSFALYSFSEARESYIDHRTQSVWYSSMDMRKKWIKKEEKARKLAITQQYTREYGQRPAYDL